MRVHDVMTLVFCTPGYLMPSIIHSFPLLFGVFGLQMFCPQPCVGVHSFLPAYLAHTMDDMRRRELSVSDPFSFLFMTRTYCPHIYATSMRLQTQTHPHTLSQTRKKHLRTNDEYDNDESYNGKRNCPWKANESRTTFSFCGVNVYLVVHKKA